MNNRLSALACVALLSSLSACGPEGKITGKVVVEGGTTGGILVRVLGPTSVGVVTEDSGSFTASALADGTYQVIAEVPNTDVTSQRATVKVTQGKADSEPTLSFKASVGAISGKIVFGDGGDASGLTVALSGTDNRGAQTDAAGAFTFAGLKAGAYLVSTEVVGSVEGRQSLSVLVAAGTPATLPDLTFTFVGTLTGNVKAGTANAPGATVEVPGTDIRATTDANGEFTLSAVPTGAHTVQARLNAAVATQQVTVARSGNTALAFVLQTALTGTVQGSIGFTGNAIDTAITVSVAGTTFTTTAAINGDFRLTLPPGDWEIVADARNYPRKSLGLTHVNPGATTWLPTARMSLYRRVTLDLPLSGTATDNANGVCEGDVLLASLDYGSVTQFTLIDTLTLSRRVVAVNGTSNKLSPKCKWVALVLGSNVVLHNTTTAEQRFLVGAATQLEFSTDESVLWYLVGTTLHRYTIATSTDDTFPANSVYVISRDRFLASSNTVAPFAYQLVTTTAASTVFTNVSSAGTFGGAAYALTDCAVSCTFRTLGTQAATASTLSGAVPPTSSIDSNNSNGEWYLLRTTAPASILVKTTGATGVPMPASTSYVRFNPALTRVAYISGAAGQALREETVPPSGAATPAANSSTTFMVSGGGGWLSDARFMIFDNATPRRIDIKTGVTTTDADVTAYANGPVVLNGAIATWGKASTTKRIAVLGDSQDFVTDVAPTLLVNASPSYPTLSPNGAGGFGTPKYGAVAIDGNTLFVLDTVKNEMRKFSGFSGAGTWFANMLLFTRPVTAEVGFFVPGYDQYLQLVELGTSLEAFGFQPNTALSVFSRDLNNPRDLLVARLLQQP